ncbi:MAG: hypothetical protein QG577_2805 [Thermodesulfobacteriota bacterium]|nr:hypothetical protein [Thermodesulfobacteriota bacterium]
MGVMVSGSDFPLTIFLPIVTRKRELKARSSGGEHHLDAVRVWGSNPHAPTTECREFPHLLEGHSRRMFSSMMDHWLLHITDQNSTNQPA